MKSLAPKVSIGCGVQRVAHAVVQRPAKAQPVDGAWAVFVDLGGGRFPAGETTFPKALDHLA